MNHPLPIRPAFLPQPPLEIPTALIESLQAETQPIAGPSRIINKDECTVCRQVPKYKCPGCSAPTCSLACSKAHKETDGCTGQRDPTAFVRLTEVGPGQWGDDYRWLEAGRRKVAEWGTTLPKGSVVAAPNARGGRGGRGRGGGQGHGQGDRRHGRDTRKDLAVALGRYGVGVEFMPEGMDRRKRNQSGWNPRTEMLHLTVHLSIAPDLTGSDEAKLVTHPRVLFAGPTPSELPTLSSLLPPEAATHDDIVFALLYHSSGQDQPATKTGKRYFPLLDPTQTLQDALKGTSFVEFPTIHVLRRSEWDRMVANGEAAVEGLHESHQSRQSEVRQSDNGWGEKRKAPAGGQSEDMIEEGASSAKYAKVDGHTVVTSKNTPAMPGLSGLAGLGDYGSDEDDEDAADEGVELEVRDE